MPFQTQNMSTEIQISLLPEYLDNEAEILRSISQQIRDLAALNKEGIVNPDSNYCFGEGGAGTFSDGKRYTRSAKRGDTAAVLNVLHYFGATADITIEAHPHIGTNKFPQIIQNMCEIRT